MPETPQFDKAALAWNLLWDADWVTAVSFAGSTRRLAAGNNLGQILVWDLPDKPGGAAPMPVRRLDGHTNVISRLLSTPDGRWLISASYDHTIRLWDMQAPAAGNETVVLNARARSGDGRRGGRTPPPEVSAQVEVQKAAQVLDVHRDWILGLSLSADGKTLLSGDDGGVVIVWDREAGKELRRWKLKGWAYAVALSPDAQQALVSERLPLIFDSGRYSAVKVWDAATGQLKQDLSPTVKEVIAAAAYSLDGKLLALARGGEIDGLNGKVFLIDPANGKKLRELTPGHLNGATDVKFHPDGKHLASCGRDTVVRIWQANDGKMVKEVGKPRGGQFKDWVHALAFGGDGLWLAAADMMGQVQIWSFA